METFLNQRISAYRNIESLNLGIIQKKPKHYFMTVYTLSVNGRDYQVEAEPQTPLLWVIRDHIGLKGTKFGCGIAQCGACTVHIDGNAMRTCVFPVAAVGKMKITTIEGISEDSSHPVQKAWVAEQVPQCGYCQSGQIMSATALLSKNTSPSDKDIDNAMKGNICRCGTYPRIRKAIHSASKEMSK